MNTNTGEVAYVPDDKELGKEWLRIGAILKIEGYSDATWRVTGMKPGGRLFLKLVK